MPLVTTIIYTLDKSVSVVDNPVSMSGYRATFTVTEAVNIDPNIFVRQREVNEPSQVNFIDSFYTIASVADMADLPVGFSSMSQPFYRVNTVTLVFPNQEDFEKYVEQIKVMIEALRKANDLVINMLPSETIGIPDNETLLRYWGASSNLSVLDSELYTFNTDDVYSKIKTIGFDTDAPRYLYFAYRDELGAPASVTVNMAPEVPVLVQRAVISENGYSHAYRIYRTAGTHTGITTFSFT